MQDYIIYFNQQWVGEHSPEWFQSRAEPSKAVVAEMQEAGVYVYAAGVEEDRSGGFSADATSGEVVFSDGPFVETKEYLGGFTVIRVATDEEARMWAGKVAQACGWPQEVRRVY